MKSVALIAVSVMAVAGSCRTGLARDYYVSPDGKDAHSGALEEPFQTLDRAQAAVRQHLAEKPGDLVKVVLRAGRYYLAQPLIFTPVDSGAPSAPVIYEASPGEKVVFVGGKRLSLQWRSHDHGVMVASVPEGTVIDQLIINGQRKVLARYPNYDPSQRHYNGAGGTSDRMKIWEHPETACIHALHQAKWGSGHAVIVTDGQGNLKERMVSIDTTTQGNGARLSDSLRFVENVFEELDAVGEWFFDRKRLRLYYLPGRSEDLRRAEVEAICTPHVVRFEGTASEPVHHIEIGGITFQGASPTWQQTTDHLPNGGDFVVHRGGAVTLRGTENCVIRDCNFIDLGGNAVFLDGYNRNDTVSGCLIRNTGANAIALCGAADTMRGDQFFKVLEETFEAKGMIRNKWEEPGGWYKIPEDRVPGPKTENYPSECVITDNLITQVGEVEKQSAGVLMSLARNNVVSHNTIFELPRAGICLNDGCWGGHRIEFNDVYDTVRETADHGPFNSWGKDRYWIWANHSGRHSENSEAKKYALIDAIEPTHICHNRFSHPLHTSHSWGIDLDDGSTNYHIYNNITFGCSVKLREGFYRTVENNIFVCSGRNVPGKHICFAENEDVYRRNIVVNIDNPSVWRGIRHDPKQMKEMGHNCYYTPNARPVWTGLAAGNTIEDWQKVGLEVGSIVADPMFVNPDVGDYSVKPGSPALELGFKNFPMEGFGVTSPRLKSQLPTRRFPGWKTATEETLSGISEKSDVRTFLGGEIKSLTNEEEKSAVGIGEITGVLVMESPEGSELHKAGLREGDLITRLNGKKTHDLREFVAMCQAQRGRAVVIEVHDDSQERRITLNIPQAIGSAEDILAATGVKGGLVVHVGCGDGKLIAEMPTGDGFLIQGLDTDPGNVEKARALISSHGLCGQVSASVFDGKHLPYIDNMVNLLVIEAVGDISTEEIMRVLTPRGVAYVRGDGGWKKTVKPVPQGIDDWGQCLYDPGGNPVGGDRLVGPPRHMQWESGPRWSRSHENMSSVSAFVSAGGRLFTIMDEGPPGSIYHSAKWSLTARDAFNGVVIWKKPLTRWQSSVYPLKSGPFQLPRRLVAVDDKVYVTLGIDTPVSELSAVTGEVLRTFEGTEATEEIIHDQGKLILTVNNEKSRLPLKAKGLSPELAASQFMVRVHGDRSVMAIDLESGKTLWKQQAGNVTPVTLATAADRVFYHADEHVHCLDLAGGKLAWQAELGRNRRYSANNGPSLLVEDDVLVFGEQMRITGVSIRDGMVLWTAEGMVSRCIAPVSLCVIDGIIWAPRSMAWDKNAGFKPEGPSGSLIGYDLHTGKKAGEWQFDESLDIGVMHHRCHMPKATDKFVLTGWPGIEFIDTRTGKMFTHNWVRGACLSGVLPANGLIYAPPNPCACYPEGRLTGFNALAPARESRVKSQWARAKSRLERGPAYTPAASGLRSPASSDWPTYRGDAMRTGSVDTSLPSALEKRWLTKVGGKLTQPVVADGKLFVASVDTHTVQSLDADSGIVIWTYQVGGRVDSSPTWHDGRVLFGSRDGYVYSVDAATGQLAWRFHAARDNRQIVSYGQLESLWPIPGNVLVIGDTACFIAGKNSYLDGGLWLYRLDAQTGEMLSETNVCFLDAEGRHARQRGPGLLRLEMTGALPDVLSSDGQYIYMRHFVFDLEGNIADTAGNNHLIVGNGFRDDSWFHRSFWTYGVGPINARSGFSQGQGNGAQMMVMDGGRLFYYGRALGGPANQRLGEKHFLSSCPKPKLPPSEAFRNSRHDSRGQDRAPDDRIWSHETKMHARGMIVGKDTLLVAGPQGDWLSSAAIYDGTEGVVLAAISTEDGKPLSEHELPASPVYDGMSAAGGRLYISLQNGDVGCWGKVDD